MAEHSAADLLVRWRAGDQQAATELFWQYGNRLISLARSRISAKLARRLDAEDVVQSACRSFFRGVSEGRYDVRQGGDLWQLLVLITLHKLQDQYDFHTAAKRNVRAELPLQVSAGQVAAPAQVLSRTPSPLEALTLVDEVEYLMRGLEPEQRQMLELRLQGHTFQEIARATRFSPRTVRRVVDQVRQRLEQRRAGELGL